MPTVTWRGKKFDARTRDMLVEVDRLVGPHVPVRPSQGSYSNSVSASAGTHSGGGAVDLSAKDLTSFQKDLLVFALRRVGFAAWRRTPNEGKWNEHIHAIAIGGPDLASGAAKQVVAYKAGLSGLKSGKPDRHAALGAPVTTWEKYLKGVKLPT